MRANSAIGTSEFALGEERLVRGCPRAIGTRGHKQRDGRVPERDGDAGRIALYGFANRCPLGLGEEVANRAMMVVRRGLRHEVVCVFCSAAILGKTIRLGLVRMPVPVPVPVTVPVTVTVTHTRSCVLGDATIEGAVPARA